MQCCCWTKQPKTERCSEQTARRQSTTTTYSDLPVKVCQGLSIERREPSQCSCTQVPLSCKDGLGNGLGHRLGLLCELFKLVRNLAKTQTTISNRKHEEQTLSLGHALAAAFTTNAVVASTRFSRRSVGIVLAYCATNLAGCPVIVSTIWCTN